MCIAIKNDGTVILGECSNLCAQCRKRNADLYGLAIPYVAAPSIHPDVIGPEEERQFREQAALRRQIELEEGDLWLFD
jgi:hypothetical protein